MGTEIEQYKDHYIVIREFDSGSTTKSIDGKLILTNYRLKFTEKNKRESKSEMFNYSSVPYGYIRQVM